jgi:hypothetical protein
LKAEPPETIFMASRRDIEFSIGVIVAVSCLSCGAKSGLWEMPTFPDGNVEDPYEEPDVDMVVDPDVDQEAISEATDPDIDPEGDDASQDTIKAVVVRSEGADFASRSIWDSINSSWSLYGEIPVRIDYSALDVENITYDAISATQADVLIIANAEYDYIFTEQELESIARYVREGKGVIGTCSTVLYNTQLSSIFGVRTTASSIWGYQFNGVFEQISSGHVLFNHLPDPFAVAQGTTITDWELVGGGQVEVVAKSTDCRLIDGIYNKAAVVTHTGAETGDGRSLYFTNYPERDNGGTYPPASENDRQLFYNAVLWASGVSID